MRLPHPITVDLVGVGLNATDTVIPLAHFPARGSKGMVSSIDWPVGGRSIK